MTTYTLTTFQDGDTILASEVNDNFQYCLADTTTKVAALETEIGTTINNSIMTFLQTIYPIGSVYIGTMATCPFNSLFGTWTLVSSGRVLQGSDAGHAAGTTIAAGLPNVYGYITNVQVNGAPDGAMFYTRTQSKYLSHGAEFDRGTIGVNAAQSSSVYGANTTVQPPAYVVNIWERTA